MERLYALFMHFYKSGFGRGAVGNMETQKPHAGACRTNFETITEPELPAKLTPDYGIFCNRLVFSGDFNNALQKDSMTLATDAIVGFERDRIRTADGTLHELDVVVMATGFETMAYFRGPNVSVEDGPTVTESWKDGARSFDTIGLAGFPNRFFVGGPFSTVGNLSVTSAFEFQSHTS